VNTSRHCIANAGLLKRRIIWGLSVRPREGGDPDFAIAAGVKTGCPLARARTGEGPTTPTYSNVKQQASSPVLFERRVRLWAFVPSANKTRGAERRTAHQLPRSLARNAARPLGERRRNAFLLPCAAGEGDHVKHGGGGAVCTSFVMSPSSRACARPPPPALRGRIAGHEHRVSRLLSPSLIPPPLAGEGGGADGRDKP
jgi:hypothetical protein